MLLLLALGAATFAAVGVAAVASAHGGRGGGVRLGLRGSFAVPCGFSHRNEDDPIVFPNQRGRSHDHTYFGNRSTNASSTPASLRAAGRTTCRLGADTAAYWAPTLFVRGSAIAPRGAVAYYIRRTFEPVRAFPAGLEMIAGSAAARSPQGTNVTYWSCGRRSSTSTTIPTCNGPNLRLVVFFPNCCDGSRLDSADHKRHMAYSSNGVCPRTHPVEVPALALEIYYGVAGGAGSELASGGQFSGHADFVNSWNQPTLERLVDRYLNGAGRRGRR